MNYCLNSRVANRAKPECFNLLIAELFKTTQ